LVGQFNNFVACPEILKGKEYLGPGVDIWAMGIILYCLVVGRQPWDGSDASSIINSILEDGLEIPDGISDGIFIVYLVLQCFH
jgi:serine/threonine protein kinase